MNRRTLNSARSLAALVVFSLALAGCSSSSSKHNNTTAPNTLAPSTLASQSPSAPSVPSSGASGSGGVASAARAQIKSNWEKFFSGATRAQEKVGLLQNGDQFQQAIQAQANSPLAKSAGASVTSVVVNGSRASVNYDVTLGGQAALSGQRGEAVLESGTWKVSDASFCQLLALESGGSTSGLPQACGAAAASSPAT